MKAFAYASGLIVFSGRASVDGTLPIAQGSARELRRVVSELARRAYDGKTLIVPGLPEARNWDERSAALMRFKAAVEKALGNDELAKKIERFESKKALRARVARLAARRAS